MGWPPQGIALAEPGRRCVSHHRGSARLIKLAAGLFMDQLRVACKRRGPCPFSHGLSCLLGQTGTAGRDKQGWARWALLGVFIFSEMLSLKPLCTIRDPVVLVVQGDKLQLHHPAAPRCIHQLRQPHLPVSPNKPPPWESHLPLVHRFVGWRWRALCCASGHSSPSLCVMSCIETRGRANTSS